MALTSGTKLGPYEIVSPLGAGGMGEVYRARDTRLDRTVAIKVLPSDLSSNSELKQRFEREARAISALQHPNICTLHDIGSQDGVDYLVMECLEGQTLAARLEKGPLPVDQVLKVGKEIAEALQKAHSQGIIHRDLKPANIMLTKSGAKLMDFGLAKPELAIPTGSKTPISSSMPTMNLASLTSVASPLTQKGSIVGTFQYLAPEVLQGAEADARSDIFSFGCVLYEMVTGRRAFEGKSQLGVLSAILEQEPQPIGIAQPMLERVTRECLIKDPAERFQSAHDVLLDLRWIAGASGAEEKAQPAKLKKSSLILLAVAALAAVLLAGLAGYWSKRGDTGSVIHAEIPAPEKYLFDATGDSGGMPVLSPQGDKIAFVAHSPEDKSLWVRSIAADGAQRLDGTQGAMHPFWSPDGQSIGFFAAGRLRKIAAIGGPVSVLAEAANPRGGTWGTNDVIVYAPDFQSALSKVSTQSDTSTPATVLDKQKHTTHRWPWFLPDGKHYLFLATSHLGGDPKQNGIYFASVDSTETHLVVSTDSAAQYASGYLLYRSNMALVAQPFDPATGKLSGSATPLINNVRFDDGVWRGIFSASQNGRMLYQPGNGAITGNRMVWLDRKGKELDAVNDRSYSTFDLRLSPDGKRVAYATGNGIWTTDLERKTRTRITFDSQPIVQPAWSPDGKELLFAIHVAQGGGNVEVRNIPSDGGGQERLLIPANNYRYPGWSPDGKYLTYLWGDGDSMISLWIVPVAGGKPVTVVQAPSSQSNVETYRVSPDSRWVAYVSDESGQGELYIASFPEGKGKWRVSANGGAYPAWSANGREVFYKDFNDEFYVCPVTPKGSEMEVGAPEHLFHATNQAVGVPFDVAADGKRLLVNLSEEETSAPLKFVSDWTAELKK
ncbi:MAG TPA: protein kinase [Terriglobales bacterium]|nr:protein kinase [Terriglobales bacterium]